MSSIKADILVRVQIVFAFVALFGVLIAARIFTIQYVDGSQWTAKAEKSHVQERRIKAERGNVYDADGRDLSVSIPFYRLAMDPSISLRAKNQKKFNEGIDSLSLLLSQYFKDKSADAYKRKILKAQKEGRQYLRLNGKIVNYLDKMKMMKWPIFREGKMVGGVIFEQENKRFKPHKELGRRTIGDIKEFDSENGGVTERGLYGVEYSFDHELSGKDGHAMFAKMSSKYWKQINDEHFIAPEQGHDVYTTIDIDIQDVAENALLKMLDNNEADNGCAVVMEVETGAIRAMANLDQIKRKDSSYYYRELRNLAVGINREPGSTMKLASIMAVLEARPDLNPLTDSVDIGKGTWDVFDKKIRDSHTWEEDRTISIHEAFVTSSNVGIAKLVVETFGESIADQTKFTDYMKDFSLASGMEFQLKGMAEPIVNTPESDQWSGIALPWMSYGYGVEMTPLQIMALYNAIANNGYYIKPRLVDYIMDDNQVVADFSKADGEWKVCSKSTVEKVQQMLLGVVEDDKGTAKKLRNDNYTIAGKTGTAQKLSKYKKGGRLVYERKYYSSFIGYFPADNPKYTILVAVDNPKRGRIYGSEVAAPVFKEISDKIFGTQIEMHQTEQLASSNEDLPLITAGKRADIEYLMEQAGLKLSKSSSRDADYVFSSRASNNSVLLRENPVKKKTVPKVVGLTMKDAIPLLENLSLKVERKGYGRVRQQSITPGSALLPGSTIKLVLSE